MLTTLFKKLRILYFKILILCGWDYKTKITEGLINLDYPPKEKTFGSLIEALSQKKLFELLKVKNFNSKNVLHFAAIYGANLNILSIIMEKISQEMLFALLQDQEDGVYSYTPFHAASRYNLDMMLVLMDKIQADQLYTLLQMGFSDHITPFNNIISQYKKGTEGSKKIISSLTDKLSVNQLLNLISAQLRFIGDSNEEKTIAVLTFKTTPVADELKNNTSLQRTNELKQQLFEQCCTNLKLDNNDYHCLHDALYNNENLLRLFFTQIPDEELYNNIKNYNGFISPKILLPELLNSVVYGPIYLILASQLHNIIDTEVKYGHIFYSVKLYDDVAILSSQKMLSISNNQQHINDNFIGLDIIAKLTSMVSCVLTPGDLPVLEDLCSAAKNTTCKIDMSGLMNLYLPLIISKRVYKEQLFIDGRWVGGKRILPNIEDVSADAEEVINIGELKVIDGIQLWKYKGRMYKYIDIPSLGIKMVELLVDGGLLQSYIGIITNLYLKSITQECYKQQELVKQFIASGSNFAVNSVSFFNLLLDIIRQIINDMKTDRDIEGTIVELVQNDWHKSYVQMITSLIHEFNWIKNTELISRFASHSDTVKPTINSCFEFEENVMSQFDPPEIKMVELLLNTGSAPESFLTSARFGFIEPLLMQLEKSANELHGTIQEHLGLLFDVLDLVEVNLETVKSFSNDRLYNFGMIKWLYLDPSKKDYKRREILMADFTQLSHSFVLAEDRFQSLCHEMVHQILECIYKEEMPIDSKLADVSCSHISSLFKREQNYTH